VGFKVGHVLPKDILSESEINSMGITDAAGDIYYCKK